MVKPKRRPAQRVAYKPTANTAAPNAAAVRPIAHKKVKAVRFNWFLLGSLFGVGSSFFMNFLVGSVILPQYESIVARKSGPLRIAESSSALTPSTAISTVKLLASATGQTADMIEAVAPAAQIPLYPREVALKISPGDTLIDVLIDNHVEAQEAHNVVAALRKEFNPAKLRVGQNIQLTLDRHQGIGDGAAVKELAIKLPNLSTVELERLANGSFSVATAQEPTTRELRRAVGKVRSSLFQAAYDAGIPSGSMNELVQAFAYDIDFQREIHPGDTIEVLTERSVTADGRVAATGKASYAALTLHGKKHEIFRFRNSQGIEAWYDAKGNSVKKSLLRTPLNAARMTSNFGMRRHPVLGYSRMHRGVDFGARTGTPIMAAGDGIVKVAGWNRGYGNFVKIQHNATYATGYGHASRIAPGIRPGARVKQGQIIAYVGSTGMSTGPHLHYEVFQNGIQVNPAQQRFNTAVALAGRDLTNFRNQTANAKAQLAKLAPNASQALDVPKPKTPAPALKPVAVPQRLASR